jgi:carbon starvation protein CstA
MTYASSFLILTQLADLLTTSVGASLGIRECNPLGFTWGMILAKIALTLAVVHLMNVYAKRLRWLVWIPSGLMLLVVVWNLLNIITVL